MTAATPQPTDPALVAVSDETSVYDAVTRALDAAYERGEREARAEMQGAFEMLHQVREFVDGFEARGDGLPLNTTDQLWIMSLRKILSAAR